MDLLTPLTLIAIISVANNHALMQSDFHPNWALLDRIHCGLSSEDRIIGGREAALGAYPWMAVLIYRSTSSLTFKCSGALINSRYVLTAAHCLTNLPEYSKLELVRVGEHDLTTDPDCDLETCADPVQEIRPELVIIPKKYNSPLHKHDIALLRLAEHVKFSRWVSPICLPYGTMMRTLHVGETTEVAGWGTTVPGGTHGSPVLLYLSKKVLDNSVCKTAFKKIDISYHQMCAGGLGGQDSCAGDSGGPIAVIGTGEDPDVFSPPRYFVVGLVSFGVGKCGTEGRPGVYTRISIYMMWILNHLEP